MTENEHRAARCKLEVREAESTVRECQNALDDGWKKGKIKIAAAQNEMEIDHGQLKEELARAKIQLSIAEAELAFAEANLARGFET